MSSTLVTNIIAAMQVAINAYWTAQSIPGSPPTIADTIGGMSAIYDTLDAYEATVRAPIAKATAGLGLWEVITGGANAALVLPAGGTWAYLPFIYSVSTVLYYAGLSGGMVAAGGTTILTTTGGNLSFALVWRQL